MWWPFWSPCTINISEPSSPHAEKRRHDHMTTRRNATDGFLHALWFYCIVFYNNKSWYCTCRLVGHKAGNPACLSADRCRAAVGLGSWYPRGLRIADLALTLKVYQTVPGGLTSLCGNFTCLRHWIADGHSQADRACKHFDSGEKSQAQVHIWVSYNPTKYERSFKSRCMFRVCNKNNPIFHYRNEFRHWEKHRRELRSVHVAIRAHVIHIRGL